MKELSIEEKAKRYDEALERARKLKENPKAIFFEEKNVHVSDYIFPELVESEDERIRKDIIWCLKHSGLKPDRPINPHVRTTMKDALTWLEKQGEQKPADKVELKFKVKYAGSKYNVLEVKDIAGVTFYGIEDEPNHIDYVNAENCEIIGSYGIKKNGCLFPTKPIMFSEQKPTWSEEDDNCLSTIIAEFTTCAGKSVSKDEWMRCNDFLNSLKERVQPQNTWRPSDEQMKALNAINVTGCISYAGQGQELINLFNDLKKLKG